MFMCGRCLLLFGVFLFESVMRCFCVFIVCRVLLFVFDVFVLLLLVCCLLLIGVCCVVLVSAVVVCWC